MIHMNPKHTFSREIGFFNLDRCKGLSDGVTAFVITLLVLGIDIPEDHRFSEQGLLSFLHKMEYTILVYAVSFLLGGTYWLMQCAILHYFRRGSRTLVWLNLLYLFMLTLLPFVTKLKAIYRDELPVIFLFAVIQVLIGASLLLLWIYALRHPRLLNHPIETNVSLSMTRRIIISPILLSAAAVAISFFSVRVGTFCFLSVPAFYLSHILVDRGWGEPESKPD
jgi:uncharacterized membrane protein